MIRAILFIALSYYPFSGYSQLTAQGIVKDSNTKLPLSFCAIAIKGSNKGCITNEEGLFKIPLGSQSDSIIISYLGYKNTTVSLSDILDHGEILLEKKSISLKEVVIVGDEDYVYTIIEQCRKNINEAPTQHSKVYFSLETEVQKKPIELLEAYYNGSIKGDKIESLQLKAGRIGLAATENNGFFVSLNTSKAISDLSLIEANDYLPSTPLQYRKSKLKKMYILNFLSSGDDGKIYHIEFIPRINRNALFSGEIWIDKKTSSILKIKLACKNAVKHPFLPLFEGDTITNVSIEINQSYLHSNQNSQLNDINFNYQLEYKNNRKDGLDKYDIKTTGLMYLYDYNNPFILPYYKYDYTFTDYRKISLIPYNNLFWNNANGLILTEKQKEKLAYFQLEGYLINFDSIPFVNQINKTKNLVKHDFFEKNNIIWSANERLRIKNISSESTNKKEEFLSNRYLLNVQLFMDVNKYDNVFNHYSATILDIEKTYYNLPEHPKTNCFLNIYFDICEIERCKMEKDLSSSSFNRIQIDSIYQESIKIMETKTQLYLKQVQGGKNINELDKWNKYVLDNLGIDNMKIFAVKADEN